MSAMRPTALGLSRSKVFFLVILPLAFRLCLPALNNNLVNLLKSTTLAYAIGVPEVLYVSAQIWSDEFNATEMMTVVLVVYAGITTAFIGVMQVWERRLKVPGIRRMRRSVLARSDRRRGASVRPLGATPRPRWLFCGRPLLARACCSAGRRDCRGAADWRRLGRVGVRHPDQVDTADGAGFCAQSRHQLPCHGDWNGGRRRRLGLHASPCWRRCGQRLARRRSFSATRRGSPCSSSASMRYRTISLFGVRFVVPDWTKATLGLALPVMANVAEIVRGAIQGIPNTQWQAARAVGLTGP